MEPGDSQLRQRRSSTAAPGGRRSWSACRPQIRLDFASARSSVKLLAPVYFNSQSDRLEVFPTCTLSRCNASLLLLRHPVSQPPPALGCVFSSFTWEFLPELPQQQQLHLLFRSFYLMLLPGRRPSRHFPLVLVRDKLLGDGINPILLCMCLIISQLTPVSCSSYEQ